MDKKNIKYICAKYNIENYTINEDKSIDVDGDVYLSCLGLTKLPLKFRNVTGYFDCSNNNLITLKGAPETVDDNFDCSYNNLITLEGAPRRVNDNFDCSHNKNLMSLEGISPTIHGNFYCIGTPVFYFWYNILNIDKSLIDSFVEEWDVIREDLVVIGLLEAWMKDNNIEKEINIEEIKSLGYKIE